MPASPYLRSSMYIHSRVRSFDEGSDSTFGPPPEKSSAWRLVGLLVVALLLIAALVYLLPGLSSMLLQAGSSLISPPSPGSQTSQGYTSAFSQSYNIYSPLIANGSANVSYPPDYGTLSSYTLNLINLDRSGSGRGPVTLSPNKAGQQHSNSMLAYGYFSHYDTQGYKPYMRYTLLGGVGAVFENVAFISYSSPHYTSIASVEDDLNLLEHSMMYNDSACCNNGHRMNILNPLHNRVSIGIAYNSTTLYFDEDFENYYVDMTVSVSTGDTVTMQGPIVKSGVSSSEAFVTFDGTPTPETSAVLNSGPREYGPGTIAGGVLPPCAFACPRFQTGITAYATSWSFTSTKMDVSFSLSDFINQYGSGVYTVYLITGNDTNTAITSYSVFVG